MTEPRMKIVALEEHLATARVQDAWARLPADRADPTLPFSATGDVARQLGDLAEERIRAMDECGVDVAVLSLTSPGVQSFAAADAVAVAREVNDLVAAAVAARPDRFEGFATVPTPAPEEAADELRRAVVELGLRGAMLHGRTLDRNLDHPALRPVFEVAAELRVPLYLHPQIAPPPVRDAYYSGFDEALDTVFAGPGIGWHYETGLQVLRLILAGTFDRHPDLQLIVGHWGEVVLFYLERLEVLGRVARHLERPVADYLRQNVFYTPSGMFHQRMLRATLELVGAERIMFSTDYPFQFAGDGGARAFLDDADLTPDDRHRIAHGNWEALAGPENDALQAASSEPDR